jgi:hypothetical protein
MATTLAALFLLTLSCVARADIAFSTSNGTVGIITNNNGKTDISSDTITNLENNALVYSYSSGKKLLTDERIFLGNDRVSVYDPSDIKTALKKTEWENAADISDVEYMDGFLYVIGLDNASVVKIDAHDYQKKDEYVYTNPQGYTARGVSLAQYNDELFALFSVNVAGNLYEKSVLVRLDGDLKEIDYLDDVVENAHSAEQSGGHIYVAGYGNDYDLSSDRSKLEKISIENNAMKKEPVPVLAASDLDSDTSQIAAICFFPSGSAVIATRESNGANANTVKIFMLDSSLDAKSKKELKETFSGTEARIVYDEGNKYFWMTNLGGGAGDSQIAAFTDAGATVKKFSSGALGGLVNSIAEIKQINGGDGGGASVPGTGENMGCGVGGFGSALAGAALLICVKAGLFSLVKL